MSDREIWYSKCVDSSAYRELNVATMAVMESKTYKIESEVIVMASKKYVLV